MSGVSGDLEALVQSAQGAVAGILVLSNSTSVFAVENSQNRQKVMLVDGLEKTEANTYFDKRHILGDAQGRVLRDRIFDDDTTIIGTLESQFGSVYDATAGDGAVKCAAVQEAFDRRAADALEELGQLLTYGGPTVGTSKELFRMLVLKLLDDKVGKNGVRASNLGLGSGAFLASPWRVAPVLKEYPALRYNHKDRLYFFREPRYRRAAERLFADPAKKTTFFDHILAP